MFLGVNYQERLCPIKVRPEVGYSSDVSYNFGTVCFMPCGYFTQRDPRQGGCQRRVSYNTRVGAATEPKAWYVSVCLERFQNLSSTY
jgi:hypothetical protein